MTHARGKLFVIDGTNGSGKATQTALLIDRLRKEGHKVEAAAFPQYGQKSAGPVEAYLAGEFGTPDQVGPRRGSIFYAVDRYAASRRIREWLDAGIHVVADRYVASNMGHQGSKIADKDERMAFYRWNDELEFGLFGIPRPDLNVILHVAPEVSMMLLEKRGTKPDAHENLEHQRAAERTYLEIAATFPGFALIECTAGDGILPVEAIHESVWTMVRPLLTEDSKTA